MYVSCLGQSRRQGEGKIVGDDVVCAFFAPLVAAEGMVPKDVVYMVAAEAWCFCRVDRQSEFAADTEKKGQWCEAILDGAS